MNSYVDISQQLMKLLDAFKEDTEKNLSGNKSAGARARKTSVLIGKMLVQYRKMSVEANKK